MQADILTALRAWGGKAHALPEACRGLHAAPAACPQTAPLGRLHPLPLPAADGQTAVTAAAKVPVIDTIGAGDFFTSGCLYGLLSGASLKVRPGSALQNRLGRMMSTCCASLWRLSTAAAAKPAAACCCARWPTGFSCALAGSLPSSHPQARHAPSAAAPPAQPRSRRRVRSSAPRRCSNCARPLHAFSQQTVQRQAVQRQQAASQRQVQRTCGSSRKLWRVPTCEPVLPNRRRYLIP